jgi:hypothetical protein
MNVKPITPAEAAASKQQLLPDFVIAAFNALISARWDGRGATVKQDDAIGEILTRWTQRDLSDSEARAAIFANDWLHIETAFRNSGWTVEYDKPGYNENYPAKFKFTPGAQRTD